MADQVTVCPTIYVVMAAFLEIQLLRQKPQNTWLELIVVLLAVPAYFLCRIFQAIERNGQMPNAINGGNEWPASS
jgi:hypothetical protein